MSYDPLKHHRRSIRLKDYDYTQPGAYFITICTQGWVGLFGEIVPGVPAANVFQMALNDAGRMVQAIWEQMPQRFPTIEMDVCVVMPNHFHGIIVFADGRATTRVAPTLGEVVGAFKSITTDAYIHGVREKGWLPFDRHVWQRDYYEHIVRNEEELRAIREYIVNNPMGWDKDPDNTHALSR